jgi:hypothetical protein
MDLEFDNLNLHMTMTMDYIKRFGDFYLAIQHIQRQAVRNLNNVRYPHLYNENCNYNVSLNN